MESLLAFHLWLACTMSYLPISRAFLSELKPWEWPDLYHTVPYSKNSGKVITKIFDPSKPVNPGSSSKSILGLDPSKAKSKGSWSFSLSKASRSKSRTVQGTEDSLEIYTPYKLDLQGHITDLNRYFEDSSYSHNIVAEVVKSGKFPVLNKFVATQSALRGNTADMIRGAFNNHLLAQKPISRLEYWVWFHVFALAASGEGSGSHALQIQDALIQGLKKLLQNFENDPAKLAPKDPLLSSLNAKHVEMSAQALKSIIQGRWNRALERVRAQVQNARPVGLRDLYKEDSRAFLPELFKPAAVDPAFKGKGVASNPVESLTEQLATGKSFQNQKNGFLRYSDSAYTHPIVALALKDEKYKVLDDFAKAQFVSRGYTPDLIRTAFDDHLLSQTSISGLEYLIWLQIFAAAVLGKGSGASYSLKAEAALQGGLFSLLEKFRLHPDILNELKVENPLARQVQLIDVQNSARALQSVIEDRWSQDSNEIKKGIEDIPFAQEIHLPNRGLGKKLGDFPEFKKLIAFDTKLDNIVRKAQYYKDETDEVSLVRELVKMAKPTTPNSIQTKTAAVVSLHYLATIEVTTKPSNLKVLAEGWVKELIEHGRQDEKDPMILEHDQLLLQTLHSFDSDKKV